ncbi:unnamed protein product [Cuscuta epithymum]|uniref:Cystatin domain-containing protein n=1 Tax=Cuscuta epithymum TaxID=186058 RepID=A0AAV0CX65_9ASTE|nr:unnamed protein product [Cuscuta epithymum]
MEKHGDDPTPDCCESPLKRFKTNVPPIPKTFPLHCGDQKPAEDSPKYGEEKLSDGSSNVTVSHVPDLESVEEKLSDGSRDSRVGEMLNPESGEDKLSDGSSNSAIGRVEEEVSSADESAMGGDYYVQGEVSSDSDVRMEIDDDERSDDSTATHDSDDEYAGSPSDYKSKKQWKQVKKYNKIIMETDGFGDITVNPRGGIPGVIVSLNLKGGPSRRLVKCTKMAIDKYNAENDANLELEAIEKANFGYAAGYVYYITFRARDTVTEKVNLYQARAFYHFNGLDHSVSFVRLAPEQTEGLST